MLEEVGSHAFYGPRKENLVEKGGEEWFEVLGEMWLAWHGLHYLVLFDLVMAEHLSIPTAAKPLPNGFITFMESRLRQVVLKLFSRF